MSASTRKNYQGKTLNDLTIEIIEAAEELLKYRKGSLTIVQGSYNGGGVAASAGTHDGGGAVDLTASDWNNKERVFRLLGCAAWKRPAIRGVWSDHVHLIVDGDSTASRGAKAQVVSYHNRRNGLANNGPDTGYKMAVFPKFVYGAVKQRWEATKDTQGYTQPVEKSTYKKKNTARKKGFVWSENNVATVRVGNVDWIITKSGTFYRKDHFKKYTKTPDIKVTKENVLYSVTADPSLYGLAFPGSGNEKKVSAKTGAKITSVGYTTLSNGEVWVKNIEGNWFLKKYLKVREDFETTPENVLYSVTAVPSLYGLALPGSGNEKKVSAPTGAKITSVGYTTLDNGEVWVKNIEGNWFSKKYLKIREDFELVAENVVYSVTAVPSLYGLDRPGSGNKKNVSAPTGAKVTSVGYATLDNGEVWVKNIEGNWFLKKYLKIRDESTEIKVMAFNLPGEDKLPNGPKRVEKAAELILGSSADIVGLNEAIGTGKDGADASEFAKSVVKAVGSSYALITPTTAYNENYVLYKKSSVSLTKQYPDKKIYARVGSRAVPGRHLTPVVFKTNSGHTVVFGVTHLVNNDIPGAQEQSVIVADELKRIASEYKNSSVVVLGDMNMTANPKGFTGIGLTKTETIAKTNKTSKYATYTNYSKTRPSTNVDDWRIDQVWVSNFWKVESVEVLIDTNLLGFFRTPRASDHHPIVVHLSN